MAQGKKSEASKRRERLVAAGLLEPEPVDQTKRANGLRGNIARHSEAFVIANLPTVQEVKRRSIARDVRDVAEGDAVACVRFLADLALGRGECEGAPYRERRAAAVDVLQLAGVRIAPTETPPGDEVPLNEIPAGQLFEALKAL